MKNKFYTFLSIVFFIAAGPLAAGAQDTTGQGKPINPPPATNCGIGLTIQRDTLDHSLYHLVAEPYVPAGRVDTIAWTIDSSFAGIGDTLLRSLANGTHTVYVSLFTSLGCQVQTCQTLIVQDSAVTPPPVGPPCTVNFNAVPNATNPKQVHFYLQDSARYDSVTWAIRIQAGQDSAVLANATGRSFTYTFPHSGYYDVLVFTRMDSGYRCYPWTIQRINVDSAGATNNFISSYPNPAASQAGIDLTLTQPAMIYIRVYNSMGNPVLSTTVPGSQGMNHIKVPIGGLGSGIYYIQVQVGQESKMSKIQKL